MNGLSATAPGQVGKEEVLAIRRLALFGAAAAMLTLAAPFAFQAGGDNAFMLSALLSLRTPKASAA